MSRSSLGTVRLAAVAAAALLAAAPSQVPTIAYNTRTSSLTATASYYQVGPALGRAFTADEFSFKSRWPTIFSM